MTCIAMKLPNLYIAVFKTKCQPHSLIISLKSVRPLQEPLDNQLMNYACIFHGTQPQDYKDPLSIRESKNGMLFQMILNL